MTTVKQVLAIKNPKIYAVKPTDSVTLALQMMKNNRVRAILVMENNQLLGIISQGDCAIKVLLEKKDPDLVLASEIMTPHPLAVADSFTTEQCMGIMVEKRVRHLPVIANQAVIGVISIGDLVGDIIRAHTSQIDFLETYIKGHGSSY
jgi:CBS domain-containing protein